MEHTGEYYLISHMTLFTGLSDRTIRNHMAAGFLQGEKINGLWHFTPEPVDAFLWHTPDHSAGEIGADPVSREQVLWQIRKRTPDGEPSGDFSAY